MSGLDRVFIDTNELYPFTVMDVLLSLAEAQLFVWVWSDDVLQEWERVIVRDGRRSSQSARSVTNAVREFFGAYRIARSEYKEHIDADLSADPDDRAHAAACIQGKVDVLLTRNARDFAAPAIAAAGVRVIDSDNYLCALLDRHPQAVVEAFRATVANRRNPPQTATQLADRLASAGTPRFASRLAKHHLRTSGLPGSPTRAGVS